MKDNKLIAEFMDYPTCAEYWKGTSMVNWEHEDYKDYYYVDGKYNHMDGSNFHVSDMQFDTSWDWLMPVIQKCLIGQTEVSRGLTNTNVSRILDGLCYQDMSRTYNAVVEFIKENNKNN